MSHEVCLFVLITVRALSWDKVLVDALMWLHQGSPRSPGLLTLPVRVNRSCLCLSQPKKNPSTQRLSVFEEGRFCWKPVGHRCSF